VAGHGQRLTTTTNMRRNAEDTRTNSGVELIPEEANVLLDDTAPQRLGFFAKGVGELYAEHVDLEERDTAEAVLRIEKDEDGALSVGLFESAEADEEETDGKSALDELDEEGAAIIERESLKYARVIARRLDGVELDAEALAEVIAEATAAEVLDAAEIEEED
jgi:hypothetical protein